MIDKFEALLGAWNATQARHKELSILLSQDDERFRPNGRLVTLAADAARLAADIDLGWLDQRSSKEPRWYQTWPGEHYRLLGALCKLLAPRRVIEVGTFTGMGALSMAQHLPPGGVLHTFDIVAWDRFPDTWLEKADFAGGRLVQHLDDLSRPEVFARHADLLAGADLLFLDGPKDVLTERALIKHLGTLAWKSRPLVVFDDIRLVNMIQIWRELDRPKLDLTSFGHWSGTGLCDFNPQD